MKIYHAILLGSYLISWYEQATQDGEVTSDEVFSGVVGAFAAIGLPINQVATHAPVQKVSK